MTDLIDDTPINPLDGLPEHVTLDDTELTPADAAAIAEQLGVPLDKIIYWYEGSPVTAILCVVDRAGAGLTDPLAAEPVRHKKGTRGSLVLDGVYEISTHKPHPKMPGASVRVERFITESAFEIDPKVVAKQRKAVTRSVEDYRAKVGDGQMRLGEGDDVDED